MLTTTIDKKKRGVYLIENRITGTLYIGSTIQTFGKRWAAHTSLLRKGTHDNIHIQRAYDRDGGDAFEYSVLEYVDDADQVLIREQYWIDHYKNAETYNICPISESRAGCKLSPEHRAEISRAQKAYHNLPHVRQRQSEFMRGRNVNTAEHYERLSRRLAKTYPGLIGPDGTIYRDITNMSAFCREHGLSAKKMHMVASGKRLSSLGWTALDADRSRLMTTSFSFRDPNGNLHEDIANLTAFCKEHGLLLSSMSQVHSRQISHHKRWTKG